MYLTNEECTILNLILKGLNHSEINQITNLKLCTNDPRIDSLYQKYGVYSRIELTQKADLSKVEVVDLKDMPYFEYDDSQLVKKIPVSKKDIQTLMKIFESVEDETECYNLVYSSNTMDESLYIETKSNRECVYERVG